MFYSISKWEGGFNTTYSIKGDPTTHLQNLDHYFLVVGDIDCLEHFAVLSPTELTNQLVVLLVTLGTDRETV